MAGKEGGYEKTRGRGDCMAPIDPALVRIGIIAIIALLILVMARWMRAALQPSTTSKTILQMRQEELSSFLLKLKDMDSDALGMLALYVAMAHEGLERNAKGFGFPTSIPLAEPHAFFMACPDCCAMLNQHIQFVQKEGIEAIAAGLFPWLHTLRAVDNPELRPMAREMWGEIARGFPYALDWVSRLPFDIPSAVHDYLWIVPKGFEPSEHFPRL